MAELIEASIVAFRGGSLAGADALARRIGLDEPSRLVAGVDVAVPLLVDAIERRLVEPGGDEQLAEIIATIDPSGLADPAAAFTSGGYAPAGLRLVDHLLDGAEARGVAARRVTDEAGLAPGVGAEVLTAAAWVIGVELHDRAGSPLDGAGLAAAVDGSPRRARPPAPTSALAPIVSEPIDTPLYRSAPRPPVRPSASGHDAVLDRPTDPASNGDRYRTPTPPPLAPVPGRGATPRIPKPGPNRTRRDAEVGQSWLVSGAAVFLGLVVVGAALLWWLNRGDDETATSAEGIGQETTPETIGGTPADEGTGDTGDSTTADDQDASAGGEQAADGGDGSPAPTTEFPSRLEVAMTDPIGRSTATGIAGLSFDTDAAEVCYDFVLDGVASPADGHIHLGPAGVKGGIIIDFGPMTDGVNGCQPVPDTELQAILSDLDGHYVELHDPIEDFTIRAQLSEGFGPDGAPVVVAGQDDQGDGEAEPVLFDPDGGGATAVVEPGRIVLRGEVADREMAERVLIDFAGLSDVIVVDELVIVEGGPLPSGRVIIDSPDVPLFASDSDQLDPGVAPLVERLTALLEARPDWQITIVGHTDSTGNEVSNLELSFRRAEAVRQELLTGGVDAARIRVRGAGSTDPIGDNTTQAGRGLNRRIEFEIER